ncbi:hypothetical protein LCGC14_0753910 [marine sediment metagenome]|uniref:Nucleotidyltransferase family protein n=2 Tax=root TaxID=1 RepID=A0A831QQV6_9FLAO|nr:nucleotidyltransferase family protein [Pricia sp.]HEA23229.1 nucleotidyltransferase family protein [Pricia antarctica]
MAASKNIGILILAAGASSRMGETKQLLPWEDTTLLGNAIQTAKACGTNSVTVVLGANAAIIKKQIVQSNIHTVENTEWQLGLGSSIACGTKFILQSQPNTEAILVLLADQPLIDTAYLNIMLSAYNTNAKGVATAYKNKAGVPALFPKSYFEELLTLDDDYGAKTIINNPKENFLVLEPGLKTRDIDTKSDYEDLHNTSS